MKRLVCAAVMAAALAPVPGYAQTRQAYVSAANGACRTSIYTNQSLTAEANCTTLRVSRSDRSANYSFGVGESRVVFITDLRPVWNERYRRMEMPVRAVAIVRGGQPAEPMPVQIGWCESTDARGQSSRRWLSCSAAIGGDTSLHSFYVSPTDLSNDMLGGMQ